MGDTLDCDVIVSEFEFLSRYLVPFQTNALGKGKKQTLFYESDVAIKFDMSLNKENKPKH